MPLPGNPYDGHTLAWSLAHTRLNTGVPIKTAVVDKGYRGSRAAWPGAEVVIPGQWSRDDAHRQQRRKQLRRRSVIEALIGHMKTDGLLNRNWLKGSTGDAIHMVLCAAGQNLRLILRAIEAFFARRFPSLWKHDGHNTTLERLSALLPSDRVALVLSAKRYMPSQTNSSAASPV